MLNIIIYLITLVILIFVFFIAIGAIKRGIAAKKKSKDNKK
tara:strand:+ start:380 stop:502 length:123 start_codon:yes stop_codon:yes gene_type:complete